MTGALPVPTEALRDLALANRVCIRPVVHEVTDTETGRTRLVPTPCGATLASKCPPCAQRNRLLRMQQCREGWHLEQEPEIPEREASDPAPREHERRTRSTRRRQDAPDLPNLPVESRTVGGTFTSPSGRVYRPSMFATFTLPSYGPVRADGTPMNPSGYDYRRAALDALHFPKLVDRLWQNLRRAVGWNVQYFSVVEEQRRLTPHLHAAVRGAIPRETFRQVVSATYHQVWWPQHDTVVYDSDHLPEWVPGVGYTDPATGVQLPTWDEALDELDQGPDLEPTHVLRFGDQLDLQGILATEDDADRRVGYLTKYLAKTFGETYDPGATSTGQRRHLDRLNAELRWLPCSPRCWNWLRYGVQPDGAKEDMRPGACPGKAHDREHLGCGGRRVLVSRRWTGKTLDRHRADRAEVVRQVLEAAGVDMHDAQRLAADVRREDGLPRYEWKVWNPLESSAAVYRQILTRTIAERIRWQKQYDEAKERTGPDPPDPLRHPIGANPRSPGPPSRVSAANPPDSKSP